ncbi:hypothetical protein MKY84_03085 [Chryseomicrobium sp. FSL W7-1435]|uniref:hypothetical protein n=1 Tax=Chryseomicrobium sp. FSL W7-1435 TaxID=2921704 RepID=UPI00315ADA61
MYEGNDIYLNTNRIAVIDYDNSLIALIEFNDNEVDFIESGYALRPKIRFADKTIVFPDMPEED